MARFEHILNVLTKSGFRVSQFCVLAMMAILVVNIILRKAWHPITGAYDFVSFMAAVVAGFAVAYVASVKGHVAVELFIDRLPERIQLIIGIIAGVLSLGVFSLVSWQSAIYGRNTWVSGEFSMTAYTPFYPFIFAVALGVALLCLVILLDIIKALVKVVKG
jgi:TRAP-type C4-dicarboxylate transport system permease small subunit